MTVGEIDFGDTFIDTIGKNSTSTNNPLNPFPEASFIFISFFLLLMTISLMNLLVGSKTRVVFYPGGTLKKFGGGGRPSSQNNCPAYGQNQIIKLKPFILPTLKSKPCFRPTL